MKRVLQVLGNTGIGGAESRVMDLYRHMDRDMIQFDFLVHRKNGYFNKEIESLGGNVYYLPPFRIYNYLAYRKAARDFFEKHNEYLAVHGHMTSTAAIYLPEAKKAGIPLTIAHARSAGVDKGVKGKLTRILRKNLYRKCDVMLACSDLAAISVFGQRRYDDGDTVFVPNAVDTSAFKKDEKERSRIRNQYNIGEETVIGHVGRFHYAKNHEFALDVFKAYLELDSDAKFMMVGDGETKSRIEEYAKEIGIDSKVIFTGNQNPVEPFYQAFDMFLFPSRYEGMPGTIVEAQAAGIPCLLSDTITKQVKVSDMVEYMSLNTNPAEWAQKLFEFKGKEWNSLDLLNTNFDVNHQVKKYMKFYVSRDVNDLR